eukprot:5235165-Prymnesium_polylepis.1
MDVFPARPTSPRRRSTCNAKVLGSIPERRSQKECTKFLVCQAHAVHALAELSREIGATRTPYTF